MAAPQQSGQPDNSMAVLWIVAAILIFGAIIWIMFKQHIIAFYFKIKLLEIDFLSYFTHQLTDVKTTILISDPAKVSFQEVLQIGEAVGNFLRYPFVVVLALLSLLIYISNKGRLFKRIYSMRSLAQLETVNWPQITPVTKLDLLKTDIDKGPWAMALTPMQFCKRHKLIEERKRESQDLSSQLEWSRIEVTLKRGEANRVFSIQLGQFWPGINRVPPHIKALFAAFAARANADSAAAAELFASINRSAHSKLDFSRADALIKKHHDTKSIQKIIHSHAYLLTVMAAMLEAARDDGVQASADFLWLKPIDRRLWYMLNTVGRQTPFVEVAGPFAHWVAEKEMGRRILVPMVEEATNALEIALKEIVYRPDAAT